MKQAQKTFVLLLAILVGLVAAILVLDQDADDSTDGDWTTVLPGVTPADVLRMRLNNPTGQVDLGRVDGAWRVTDPVDTPADSVRVERLLEAAIAAQYGPALPTGELADFGLEPVVHRLAIEVADGHTHQLQVGRSTPVGGQSYLRVGDSVHLSRMDLSPLMQASLFDLRTREVVQLVPTAVDGLRVEAQDWSMALARDTNGWWWVTSDARIRVAPQRVSAFVQALVDLRVDEFLNDAPKPGRDFIRIQASSDGRTDTMEVYPPSEEAWMARSPLHSGLLRITPGLADALPSRPDEWVSALLMPVRTATLSRVVITLGRTGLEAERVEGGWSDSGMESLLEVVATTPVSRATPMPSPAAQWGEIRLEEGAQRTSVVTLHQAVPGGRVAQESAGGPPFFISDDSLAALGAQLAGKAPVEQAY